MYDFISFILLVFGIVQYIRLNTVLYDKNNYFHYLWLLLLTIMYIMDQPFYLILYSALIFIYTEYRYSAYLTNMRRF